MAAFIVSTPDGGKFRVNAPEGATEHDAISFVQDHMAGGSKDTGTADAVSTFLRGATLGGSDYAMAAGRYLDDHMPIKIGPIGADIHPTHSMSFNDALKDVRKNNEDYDTENPMLAPSLELAGGIVPGFGKVIGGTAQLVKAGVGAAESLAGRKLPAFLARGAEGAGVGAVAGGLSAQGEDGGIPTVGDVGQGMKTGGVFGAGAGIAAPYLATPVAWAGKKLTGGAQAVLDKLPFNQASVPGRKIAEAMDRSNITLDQLLQNRDMLGPNSNAVDAAGTFDPNSGTWLGGRAVRSLADTLVQMPGETGDLAERIMKPRPGMAGSEVIDATQRHLAPGTTFHDTLDSLEKSQQKQAGPLYDEAFGANKSVSSPLLDRLLNTPAGKDALAATRERMQNKMSQMAVPDPELTEQLNDLVARGEADPSKGGVASGLKLQTHDLIKQNLGDQYNALKRQVVNGTARKGALSDLGDLIKSYTKELDNLDVTAQAGPNSLRADGGAYARARQAYAGPAKSMDAMEAGRDFLTGDREITTSDFADMGDSEKQMFRLGVARELQGMVEQNRGTIPSQLQGMLNPESKMRKVLQPIFPTQQSFDDFIGSIGGAVRKVETSRMLGGSPTMTRGQHADDLGLDLSGAAIHAIHGNAPGAITSLLRSVGNYAKMPLESERNQMGRLLLDPSAFPELERALRERATPSSWGRLLPSNPVSLLGSSPGRVGGLFATQMTGPSNQQP